MNTRTDKPAREDRAEKKRRERRKRDTGVIGLNLGVNTDKLDFNNFSYRIINDRPGRLHAKIQDDWDVVHQDGSEIKPDDDMGSAVSFVVGVHKDGSPMRAYLCRKHKDWYDEDQQQKVKMLESQLAQLRRGNTSDGQVESDYVPSEGIRI